MIEERGRVLGVDGGHALVQAAAKGGCSACSAASGCGVSKLGKLVRTRPQAWRIENTLDARPGDEVVLGIADEALLQAAVIAYGLPVLGLVAGAVASPALGSGPLSAVLASAAGLAAGLLLARRVSRRLTARLAPRMVSRPVIRLHPPIRNS